MTTNTNPTGSSGTPARNPRRRTGRRKGKIGRLPHAVREELNRRLWDGEAGGSLLAWLNGLPRAREARPITKQNLSEWRKGGWEDWLDRQESREGAGQLAEEIKAMEGVAGGRRFSDVAASMAGLDLGVLLQATRRMEDGPEKTRAVLQIVHELVRLRTSDRTCERARREAGAEAATCGVRAPRPHSKSDGAVAGGAQTAVHGVRTKRLEVKPLHLPTTAVFGVVQGGPRKSGQIKVGEVTSESGLRPGGVGEVATRGVRAPRLQETDGGDREKLGLADRVRAGAGMEDGPEENSSGATRFPFAPMRAAD